MKIRDGKVANRPIYMALAVTCEGTREILGCVKAGVHVREATEDEACVLLANWSAAIFKDQGLPPAYPAACYRAVWSRFSGGEQAPFTTGSIDGQPVCVQAAFAGERRAVAWTIAGVRTDKRYSLAVPLMYWDTICWALRGGCIELDLVGAPTEGVARYKRKWGVEERTYSVLRHQSTAHRVAARLVGDA